jgi:hypothetical protein
VAAELALIQVLDELQEVGVLQRDNLVDIEDLLNMCREQMIEDATDEEIFGAIQKMCSGEQDQEGKGGDGHGISGGTNLAMVHHRSG